MLDEILLRRAGLSWAADAAVAPEVSWAWRELLREGGAIRVSELAAGTGWSERHLTSRFRAEIGLAPKAAARVIRFDRARKLLVRKLTAGGDYLLADLAADCGYFDQAHLAREFRALAGCPPSQWLAEEFRNVQAGNWLGDESWEHHSCNLRRHVMPSTPEPQVWPTLRARDARALIRFLVDAFGFEETVVYGDGDRVDHAQLVLAARAAASCWARSATGTPTRTGRPRRPGPGRSAPTWSPTTWTRCTQRAKAAGAEIIAEPYDTDYGSHDFAAADPEGNRWSFGTYRGEPRKG